MSGCINKANSKVPIANTFVWVTIEKLFSLCILFTGNAVLARILSPKDFGIVGILSIFLNFGNIIVDSGMGGALVRLKAVKRIDYSTLFVFNSAVSLLLYTLFFWSAPYVATFYQNQLLCPLLRVLSLCLIFNSISITQYVKLVRSLRMKTMCVVALFAAIFSTSISIALARAGFGVWALVMLQVINSFTIAVLYCFLIRDIPALRFCRNSFKKQFAFGINLVGANIAYIINTNIYPAIIGKVYSLKELGLFSQNMKCFSICINTVSMVIDKASFSILSRQLNEAETLYEKSSSMSKYIYMFIFPFYGTVAVLSQPTVTALLGKQWTESAWILSTLMLGSFSLTIKAVYRNLFKTAGLTKNIFHIELMCCAATIFIVLIATRFSFVATVFCLVISQFFSVFLFLLQIKKIFGIKLINCLIDMLNPILATIVCSLSAFLFYHFCLLRYFEAWGCIIIGGITAMITASIFYLLTRNKEFLVIFKILKARSTR